MVRTVELAGFNNLRVLPQQALTRVTVDVSEADKTMRDLKLMDPT